jgi:hypothetical protein
MTETLQQVVTTGDAVVLSLQVDQRSAIRGFIAGSLQFADGSTLHRPTLPRPAHKHTESGVEASPVPTLSEILDHILRQTHP